MWGLGDGYSVEAESEAFKKLHNLNVAINMLKQQGNTAGVQQLLPYYRNAIDDYRDAGANDPAYLSNMEKSYLAVADFASSAGTVVGAAVNKLMLVGLVVALIFYMKNTKRGRD